MKHTQFADYHGHGWVFRAVFKKDRKGNLLDLQDKKISHDDSQKFAKAVHLKDIHLARGMQCADCHFDVDSHGNGMLYGEPRNATTIKCIDCHGTVDRRPTLITTGNAGRIDLLNTSNTPWGPRFTWEGNILWQQSTMTPDMRWEVPQTIDTVDPVSPHYNAKSAYAKTLQRDGKSWGVRAAAVSGDAVVAGDAVPGASNANTADESRSSNGDSVPGYSAQRRVAHGSLAHSNEKMDCQVCHTSWATSCFGCHLPMKANTYTPQNKFEGVTSRNFTTYNPQVVRDDVFMLGIDGTVKKNRMAVIRSSSAVVVSSQNANREWVYSQAQTVSAEGYSGQAFNPHFPHTTSGVGTTKNCTDCHLSKSNDNNAWMTQLLGFGTGTVNFFGRYAWVARREERLPRRHLDRARRAAGRDRQLPAQDRLSGELPEARRQPLRTEGRLRAQRPRRAGCRAARRVSLHRERARRHGGVRRREHRPERLLRAYRHRAGLAARPAHLRAHAVRNVSCVTQHARARSRARSSAGKRRAADRHVLRLRLRLRPAGGARRHQRRHAGRRQSREQLPEEGCLVSIPAAC